MILNIDRDDMFFNYKLIKLKSISLVLVLFLFHALSNAAEFTPGYSLNKYIIPEKLFYGMALFDSLQGRNFSALSKLVKSKARVSSNYELATSQQLLGDLYSDYGLQRQASNLFYKVVKNPDMVSVHDRAWFSIARLRFRRNFLSDVSVALQNISGEIPISLLSERDIMLSKVYLYNNNFTAVKKLFLNNKDQSWQLYTKLNFAIALVKDNKTSQAIELLMAITKIETNNNDQWALRDKANLTLGYILLKQNKAEKAIMVFNQIRLNGTSSNKALLGLGLAWKQQKRLDKVLSAWIALANRDLSDSSVQEAVYLIPTYLEKNSQFKNAAIQYRNTNKRFDLQLARIEEITGLVKQGELLQALQPQGRVTEKSLYWINTKLPQSIASPYLYKLVATTKFQNVVKNYQDILYLQQVISEGLSTLLFLSDYTKNQLNRNKDKLESIVKRISKEKIKELEKQRDSVAIEVNNIQLPKDIDLLANKTERFNSKQLENVNRRLNLLPYSQAAVELQSRYLFLTKVLQWQLESSSTKQLENMRNNLEQLNSSLKKLYKLKNKLLVQNKLPKSYQHTNDFIKKTQKRTSILKTELNEIIKQQEKYIESLAVNELNLQKSRLQSYQRRTRFAQARLFDQLAQAEEVTP